MARIPNTKSFSLRRKIIFLPQQTFPKETYGGDCRKPTEGHRGAGREGVHRRRCPAGGPSPSSRDGDGFIVKTLPKHGVPNVS